MWIYVVVDKNEQIVAKTVDFYIAKYLVEIHKALHIKPIKV